VVLTSLLLLVPVMLTRQVFPRWGDAEQTFHKRLLQELQQGLGALREIRVYGREPFFDRRFARAREGLSRIQRRRLLFSDVLRWSVETIFVVVLLFIVALVAWGGNEARLAPLLGLYAYAGFRAVPSANRITLNLNSVRGALPVVRDLNADLTTIRAESRGRDAAGDDRFVLEREITVSGVEYRYSPHAPPALKDVDLRIRRGESIGIIGSSGAGKSTLVDVLLGLIEPTRGAVLVDGRDIRRSPRAWQSQIGYVAQSFSLLDDTLACNIAFGLDPATVDPARLAEAICAARLEEVVAALPQGIDTPIGELGTRLSGGERQRVAIARALYNRPDVLVFDEATAALDPQTEREVTSAIAALHGLRTIVVIAHRLSTVRGCDRLVVMREGRVHRVGTFDDLLRADPEFRAQVNVAAQAYTPAVPAGRD
jgi:ATP-binding cassette subfamily C protein